MHETRIFKARATRQQRTGIPERQETSKMGPPGADCLHSSQAVAQGGMSRGLLHPGSLGWETELQIQTERSTKQDKVASGKSYTGKNPRDLWRVPSSSQSSTERETGNKEVNRGEKASEKN